MKSVTSRIALAAALLLPLLGPGAPARADVIFSNFARNDSYDSSHAMNVGYISDFNLLRHVAVQFQVGKRPVTLDRVDLAMGSGFPPNVVDLEILRNVNGLPGPDNQALESFHLMNTLPAFGGSGPPLMINSALHPFLEANTNYWLTALAARPTLDEWNYNLVGDMETFALRDNNGNWMSLIGPPRPAFRILATPVAEPATLGLLSIVALGLLAYRRRRAAIL